MCRVLITSKGRLKSLFGVKKYYVTAINSTEKLDWRTLNLEPQSTTNPGAKNIASIIFFGRIKSHSQFEEFRRQCYNANYYVLIPENTPAWATINYLKGHSADYVKTGTLPADKTQYLVQIGDQFDNDEPSAPVNYAPKNIGATDPLRCTLF